MNMSRARTGDMALGFGSIAFLLIMKVKEFFLICNDLWSRWWRCCNFEIEIKKCKSTRESDTNATRIWRHIFGVGNGSKCICRCARKCNRLLCSAGRSVSVHIDRHSAQWLAECFVATIFHYGRQWKWYRHRNGIHRNGKCLGKWRKQFALIYRI